MTTDGVSLSDSSQEQEGLNTLSITGSKKIMAPQDGANGDSSQKAMAIISRVRDKLTGKDFAQEVAMSSKDASDKPLSIEKQVNLLILQATDNENLCQCYIGWCPFW